MEFIKNFMNYNLDRKIKMKLETKIGIKINLEIKKESHILKLDTNNLMA